MTRSRVKRALVAPLAALALASTVVMVPTPSGAEEDPTALPVRCTKADYPDVEFPEPSGLVCAEIRLTEGDAKFGEITSEFQDLIVVRQVFIVQISFGPEGLAFSLTPLPEGDGSVPLPTVEVPGGLLAGTGAEALAPFTDPVTGVSATLRSVGPLTTTDFDIDALAGGTDTKVTTAHLPLAVQVNNLLLGETCNIGTPDSPIDLHLDLLLGDGFSNVEDESGLTTVIYPATLSDDSFAIPAASGCGIGGTGALLEEAGLGAANPFGVLVNQSAGLPSPAGANHVAFDGVLAVVIGF